MAGNTGVATASMADMTDRSERTRAMGMVGAAFGVGFVVGPVVGGLTSTWNMSTSFPGLEFLHPFSFCALISFGLALLSALRNLTAFQETLPEAKESAGQEARWIQNPILAARKDLAVEGFPTGVLINFLFLFMFSGFEFSVSFLLKLRFGLAPSAIGMVFLYTGMILIFGQGFLVRKLSHRFRERSLILFGLALMPVPLAFLPGVAPSLAWALLLFFPISIGASLIQPSLTGLASLLAPKEKQGFAMGVFRSAGSLARATGPLAGSYFYWHAGSRAAYYYLGGGLLVVLFLALRLRNPGPDHTPGATEFTEKEA